jgi:hypothetical protein
MLKSILTRGFLPQELPPLFTSKKLGALATLSNLPVELIARDSKAKWTQPVSHNLARPGGLRRRLSIPNPGSYFRLAQVFSSSLPTLAPIWASSPYSKTSPVLTNTSLRAVVPNSSDRASPRALSRVGARYLLRTDISQFYSSVYTHLIPWVLHSKSVAKAKSRDITLLGNALDKELMACQNGQTKGITIGPDVSLRIAELLLSGVDKKLSQECRIVSGTRFIDDIELTFTKLADAEAALAGLERLLAELELQLNASKTKSLHFPTVSNLFTFPT